jgi:hypothetical protein
MLALLLARLLEPNSGSIHFDGRIHCAPGNCLSPLADAKFYFKIPAPCRRARW